MTWALMAEGGLKMISNLLGSTDQRTSLPNIFNYIRTCLRGNFMTTAIMWAWRYNMYFLARITNLFSASTMVLLA